MYLKKLTSLFFLLIFYWGIVSCSSNYQTVDFVVDEEAARHCLYSVNPEDIMLFKDLSLGKKAYLNWEVELIDVHHISKQNLIKGRIRVRDNQLGDKITIRSAPNLIGAKSDEIDFKLKFMDKKGKVVFEEQDSFKLEEEKKWPSTGKKTNWKKSFLDYTTKKVKNNQIAATINLYRTCPRVGLNNVYDQMQIRAKKNSNLATLNEHGKKFTAAKLHFKSKDDVALFLNNDKLKSSDFLIATNDNFKWKKKEYRALEKMGMKIISSKKSRQIVFAVKKNILPRRFKKPRVQFNTFKEGIAFWTHLRLSKRKSITLASLKLKELGASHPEEMITAPFSKKLRRFLTNVARPTRTIVWAVDLGVPVDYVGDTSEKDKLMLDAKLKRYLALYNQLYFLDSYRILNPTKLGEDEKVKHPLLNTQNEESLGQKRQQLSLFSLGKSAPFLHFLESNQEFIGKSKLISSSFELF